MAEEASSNQRRNRNAGGIVILVLVILALAMCKGGEVENKPTGVSSVKFEDISNGMVFSMIAPADMSPDSYVSAAKSKCEGKTHCQVIAWIDPGNAATAMPLLERELRTAVFSYSLNRTTDFEQALWNCTKFKRPDKDHCLPQ